MRVEVYDITGDWDSMVIANFRDRKELNRFIEKDGACGKD
jgi:DNA-binding Lrp family transcriptional regulator